ncbi:hypothetical protein SAMN04488543_1453 [Friedmanniella luteola]|uniref:Uncharacterized protein n=1 Tax=Friedmanniella luteola TaxID=546871 RepID=A0A1H1R125_9ACTN|nr:hypothetical protein [Friedmanniella luteola]SDS29403.1 hypothetical protein SAMN04488543_1453 [Friedmanniella luteola]
MATLRRRKAVRVLGGTALMLAFVAVVLALLVRQAGEWGVPYFSFTSAHGSPCRNDLTGITCEPLNLADVEFFADLDLPADTVVLAGSYRATHDYEMSAQLRVPKASAKKAYSTLRESFGPCREDVATPLSTRGVRSLCAMASENGADESGELPSRLFSVGTGVDAEGDRLVGLSIRSR